MRLDPASLPQLRTGEALAWLQPLDLPTGRLEELASLLTSDERERAARYRFDHSRRDFTVCRGALRLLLAAYMACAPTEVRLKLIENGKPALESDGGVEFNVSHSGDWGLIALTKEGRLGCDIERKRPQRDASEMAAVSFSTGEQAVFESLPAAQRLAGFYNAWTRKEAFIKATGRGLAFGLSKFDVTLAPNEPARLLRVEGDAKDVSQWSIMAVAAAEGYAAAVALDVPDATVSVVGPVVA